MAVSEVQINNECVSAKEIWLTYFNNALYEKGIITEKEKIKMNSLICQNCRKEK